jgi:hypothetical protein
VTPPPLRMRITAMTGSNGSGALALTDSLEKLTVQVTNRSGNPLSPHFATSTGATTSPYWRVLSGPAVISPGATVTYVLLAPFEGVGGPGVTDRILLRAVTPTPMSLTTQLIGVGPDARTVVTLRAEAEQQAKRQALAEAEAKAKAHAKGRKSHNHSIEADAR